MKLGEIKKKENIYPNNSWEQESIFNKKQQQDSIIKQDQQK